MLTNKKLVFNEKTAKTKRQVLDVISKRMVDLGYIKNKKPLLDAFVKRENEFSTGLGEQIAIPHAEVDGLKEAIVSIVKVNDVEWDSMDGKPVKTVVAIMVPKGGRGEHLTILAELSKKMVNDEFIKVLIKGTQSEIIELVNSIETNVKEVKGKENSKQNKGQKYIIGITACPTGIAHTFMAQQKIIDAAEEKGYDVKVETQGSEGQKDRLTIEDIKKADAIIISTGIELYDMEKFNGFEGKIYKSNLQNTIKNNKQVLEDALKHAEGFKPSLNQSSANEGSNISFTQEKKSKFSIGMGHMMSGISAFIPLIITAGLLMAIGNIGGLYWVMNDPLHHSINNSYWLDAANTNEWVIMMYWVDSLGLMLMKFMFPFFTMYLAMSIGGKVVMIPSFIVGMMAAGLEPTFMDPALFQSDLLSWAYPTKDGFIASGFFGAIIGGFFIGTIGKFMNNKIQVSPNMITFKTLLIIPVGLSLAGWIFMGFLVDPAFGLVNYGISNAFKAAGESGAYLYNLSIASGMAFDLGGPVNKAALSVAYGFLPEADSAIQWLLANQALIGTPEYAEHLAIVQTFNVTGKNVGQVIPPIGIGLATLFGNKISGRQLFTEEDKQIGGQATFLGIIAVSEGAIPFLIKFPLYVIIADIIGAMFGVTIALLFGTIQTLAIPAVWGWFLAGSTTIGIQGISPYSQQIMGYFAGVTLGSLLTAGLLIAMLTFRDVKLDKKTRVYNKKSLEAVEDKTHKKEMIETNKTSISIIKEYLINELQFVGGSLTKDFDKLSDKEIKEIKISFSKEKVLLGKEQKKMAKINYLINKNKTAIRANKSKIDTINIKISELDQEKDSDKVEKLNNQINKTNKVIENLNENIKGYQKELDVEVKNVANHISKQINTLERI